MQVSFQLVKPSIEYKKSVLAGLQAFKEEGLGWAQDLDLEKISEDFADFVQNENAKKTWWTKEAPVDETELWAIVDGKYAGRVSIRHDLNDTLRVMGGHIGYDTCPGFRGRGVASEMLKQALPVAKSLGLREVLLTCNDNNIASIKVIEKNGGQLREIKPQVAGGPPKRYYWIDL